MDAHVRSAEKAGSVTVAVEGCEMLVKAAPAVFIQDEPDRLRMAGSYESSRRQRADDVFRGLKVLADVRDLAPATELHQRLEDRSRHLRQATHERELQWLVARRHRQNKRRLRGASSN